MSGGSKWRALWLRFGAIGAVIIMAAFGVTTQAHASPHVKAVGDVSFAAPSAAAESTCGINVGGHQGYYICEYPPTLVRWPDGHYQWFVVGTDSAVWDTWQISPGGSAWSNWRSLGGVARSSVGVTSLSASNITIRVLGTNGGFWCKAWYASSDWGSWYSC